MHGGNLRIGAKTVKLELSFHTGGLPLARTLCDALVPPCCPHSSPAAGGRLRCADLLPTLVKAMVWAGLSWQFIMKGKEEKVKKVFVYRAILAASLSHGCKCSVGAAEN